MISKIIQKEKERQEELLEILRCNPSFSRMTFINVHKQSLINLKEYMEEEIEKLKPSNSGIPLLKFDIIVHQLEEDIQELNRIIERYAFRDK